MPSPALLAARSAGVHVAAGFDWSSVGGLKAWVNPTGLSAYNDGDLIGTWADASGGSRDLTAAGGARPTCKAGANGINGLKVARFNGTANALAHLAGAQFITGTGLTLAIVFRRQAAHAYGRTVSCHNTARSDDNDHVTEVNFNGSPDGNHFLVERVAGKTSQTVDTTAGLHLIWFDGTDVHQRFNGAPAESSSAASTGNFGIDHLILGAGFVGGSISYYSQDDVAELLLWDNDIGSTNRGNLETDLLGRYAL